MGGLAKAVFFLFFLSSPFSFPRRNMWIAGGMGRERGEWDVYFLVYKEKDFLVWELRTLLALERSFGDVPCLGRGQGSGRTVHGECWAAEWVSSQQLAQPQVTCPLGICFSSMLWKLARVLSSE